MEKKKFLELLKKEEASNEEKIECIQHYLDNHVSIILGGGEIPVKIDLIKEDDGKEIRMREYVFKALQKRITEFE